MEIKCEGRISVISTETKLVRIRRKGYFRLDKFIDAKQYYIRKKVPLKKPYLYADIILKVNEEFIAGAWYIDENGVFYVCACIDMTNPDAPESILRVLNPCVKSYEIPAKLMLTAKPIFAKQINF